MALEWDEGNKTHPELKEYLQALLDEGVGIVDPSDEMLQQVGDAVLHEELLLAWDDSVEFRDVILRLEADLERIGLSEALSIALKRLSRQEGKCLLSRLIDYLNQEDYSLLFSPCVLSALPHFPFSKKLFLEFFLIGSKAIQKEVLLGVEFYNGLEEFGRVNGEETGSFLLGLDDIFDEELVVIIPYLLKGISCEKFSYSFQINEKLLASENEFLERAGIISFSLLRYEGESEGKLAEALQKLEKYTKEERRNILAALTFAYGHLLELSEYARTKFSILSELDIPEVRFQVIQHLSRCKKKFAEDVWYRDVIMNMATISMHSRDSIKRMDLFLSSLVRSHSELVFDFLEKWIRQVAEKSICSHGFLEIFFDHTLSRIKDYSPKFLKKAITRWFVYEMMAFHFAAGSLAKCYRAVSPCLDQEELNRLSVEEISFLIHKVLGHVYLCDPLCSLVFSVLESGRTEEKVVKEVERAFGYIVYNYPHALKEFLVEKKGHSDNAVALVASRIIENNQLYFENISKLKFPKELEGSPVRLAQLEKENYKCWDEACKKEREQSALYMLAKKVTLKYGRSSFHEVVIGDKHTFTAPRSLQSIIDGRVMFPRGEYLDPVGHETLRFGYRIETKGDI